MASRLLVWQRHFALTLTVTLCNRYKHLGARAQMTHFLPETGWKRSQTSLYIWPTVHLNSYSLYTENKISLDLLIFFNFLTFTLNVFNCLPHYHRFIFKGLIKNINIHNINMSLLGFQFPSTSLINLNPQAAVITSAVSSTAKCLNTQHECIRWRQLKKPEVTDCWPSHAKEQKPC